MPKTTLSEIKHIIHERKDEKEQTTSKNNNLTPIKPMQKEKSVSTPTISKNIIKNTDSQKQIIECTEVAQYDSATFFSTDTNGKKNKNSRYSLHDQSPYHKVSISSEMVEQLKMIEGEFTIKELSKKFNIPSPALYYWARKNQYQPKRGTITPIISDVLKKDIFEHLHTMSTAELARKYNISYHILYYWIKKQGFITKRASEFPEHIQQELREKCKCSSLKDIAQEYGLSEQTMRSRLKNIGCFPDGKGRFLIIDNLQIKEIIAYSQQNGIEKTAQNFHSTKIAIKSCLKHYGLV